MTTADTLLPYRRWQATQLSCRRPTAPSYDSPSDSEQPTAAVHRRLGCGHARKRLRTFSMLVSRGGCITFALMVGRRWRWWVRSWDCPQQNTTRCGRAGDRCVAAADRPAGWANGPVGASGCAADRRRAAAPTASWPAVSHHGRTRGAQPRGGRRPVVPQARGPAGAGPVNGVHETS
jgi:hypothetical protein